MTEAERPSSSNIAILPIIELVDTRKVTTSDDERLENHRAPDKAALPGGVRNFQTLRIFTSFGQSPTDC